MMMVINNKLADMCKEMASHFDGGNVGFVGGVPVEVLLIVPSNVNVAEAKS